MHLRPLYIYERDKDGGHETLITENLNSDFGEMTTELWRIKAAPGHILQRQGIFAFQADTDSPKEWTEIAINDITEGEK